MRLPLNAPVHGGLYGHVPGSCAGIADTQFLHHGSTCGAKRHAHHISAPRTARLGRMRTTTPLCVRSDYQLPLPPALASSQLRFGSIEESDVPACVSLLLHCFYKDALTIASQEFSETEMELLRPSLAVANDWLTALNRVALTFELRKRIGARFQQDDDKQLTEAPVMLALQECSTAEIIGVVELSVEPFDGLLPGDIRLPRLPWATPLPRTAYICNLAVRSQWRGRGIGTGLLRAAEGLAHQWGLDTVCLHASREKPKLMHFYLNQEYESLPQMDQPGWVDTFYGREPVRYFKRTLGQPACRGSTEPSD